MSRKTKVVTKVKEKSAAPRYEHLNADAQAVLSREAEIMSELGVLSASLQEQSDALNAKRDEARSANSAIGDEFEAKIRKLTDEKEALLATTRGGPSKERSTDLLKQDAKRDELLAAIDSLDAAKAKASSAELALSLSLKKVERIQKEKKAAAEKRGHKRIEYTSVKQVKKLIRDLEVKEEKQREKGQDTTAVAVAKKRHELNNALGLVEIDEQIKEMDTEILSILDAAEDSVKLKSSTEAAVTEKRAKIDSIRKELDVMQGLPASASAEERRRFQDKRKKEEIIARNATRDAKTKTFKEMDAISERIRVLRNEKRAALDKQGNVDPSEVIELRKKRAALNTELDACKEKVPHRVIPIDKEYANALVGPKGATINQLSKDFSCVVDVRWAASQVTVRGCDEDVFEQCKEAVEAILAEAKANRVARPVTFDPTHIRELVRELHRIEKLSNTRITRRKDEPILEVQGAQEGVDVAKELLAEFAATMYSEEVDMGESVMKHVRGKLLMEVQSTTGCRNVSRNADFTVTAQGKKSFVTAAVEMLLDIKKKIGECKLEIVIPKGVYQRDIVGPKGKNIRAITSATGTYIDVNDPLLIMGSEEAVDTAKELLRSLFQDIRKEEIVIEYPADMHPLLTRVPAAVKDTPTKATKEVKPESETAEKTEAAEETNEKEETEKDDENDQSDNENENEEEEEGGDEPADETPDKAEPTTTTTTTTTNDKPRTRRSRGKRSKPVKQYCALERARRDSGCDAVNARRGDGKIILVGTKEQVDNARTTLEAFIASRKVSEIVVDGALLRKYAQKPSLIAQIRKIEGMEDVFASNDIGFIRIQGSTEAVEKGEALLSEAHAENEANLGKIEFERGRAGAIYGAKGGLVSRVEKECEAVVHVDKIKGFVLVVSTSPENTAKALKEFEDALEKDKIANPVVHEPVAKGGKKGGKGGGGGGGGGGGKGEGGEKGSKGGKGKKGGKGGEKGGKGKGGGKAGGKKGGD